MIEVGQLALDLVQKLVIKVIADGVSYQTLSFFERRRIDRRIEDAVAEVVEPLLPFLNQEKIPEDKQRRLIETCVEELRPLTEKPERLFQGSLDGQKIFDELYSERDLPQVIREDDLKEIYSLLCPRIATVICQIPAAVKDWENEAWSENYRRLDDITLKLRQIFTSVDELALIPERQADEILTLMRRTIAQRIKLQVDLTGLRADRPLEGKFEDFYVSPELERIKKENKKTKNREIISETSFKKFVIPGTRAIIVGAPGAGKSTWAKWFQRAAFSSNWTGICIRIELRTLVKQKELSLHEIIRNTVGKHLAEDVTAERLRSWIKARKLIFILDGFDEIRPVERDNIFNWIIDLSSALQKCPMILTSRPLTSDHLNLFYDVHDWQQWEICPFNKERIIDYILRWYKFSPVMTSGYNKEINAEHLATEWRSDPTIKPLTGNPLLLSTLLMVHHLDGSLPTGRSQLYLRYVEGMLGLWDDRRSVVAANVELSLIQKRVIVREFALRLFFDERDQLDETETIEWLKGHLKKEKLQYDADNVLSVIQERSGLIVGPGIYSFSHKSITEYLVAEVVLQGVKRDNKGKRIDRFALFEARNNDRWNTVTFLWAGLAPVKDVEEFVEECIDAGDYSLAYGILGDQFNRIPNDICRRLILKSKASKTLFSIRNRYPRSVISRPASVNIDHQLVIPSFDLRGLGLRAVQRFDDLITRAIKDEVIKWSDVKDASKRWSVMVAMSGLTHFQEHDQIAWKESLDLKYCPEDTLEVCWYQRFLEHSLLRAIEEGNKPLEPILDFLHISCPQYSGIIPNTIMSIGLGMLYGSRNPIYNNLIKDRSSILEIFSKLLNLLPESDNDCQVAEWLIGSRNWVLLRGKSYEDEIGDLYEDYKREIKSLTQKKELDRNESYKMALKYINKLIKQRKEIEVNT